MTRKSTAPRALALTLLLTGTMLASAAFAAPIDTTRRPGPPSTEWNLDAHGSQAQEAPSDAPWIMRRNDGNGHGHGRVPFEVGDRLLSQSPARPPMSEHCPCMGSKPMPESAIPLPPDARRMLEDRIGSLHAKLGITPEQEPVWQKVEQAMRANEESMHAMIMDKRARKNDSNAVESLERAQRFAMTHANNLENVIGPFRELYNSMPEAQRQKADEVFKEFRGMGGMHRPAHHRHKMTGKHSEAAPMRDHKKHGMKSAPTQKQARPEAPPAPPASAPAPAGGKQPSGQPGNND